MTPSEANKKILKIIEETLQDFGDYTEEKQKEILKELDKLISGSDGLDLTSRGFIKSTGKNIVKSLRITKRLEKVAGSGDAQEAISGFAEAFDLLSKANNKFFKDEFGSFNPSKVLESTIDIAVEQTLLSIQGDQFTKALISPIRQMLNSAITEGLLFNELTRQLSTLVTGIRGNNKLKQGILENHWTINRITRDSLFQFNRNYHKVQGSLTNGSWYQYIGGLVKDSRDECIRRVKVKYFHKKEIEDWIDIPKKDWPEKIPGVSPFIQCGGYNCLHNILLISERRVPQKRIDEVKALYNI